MSATDDPWRDHWNDAVADWSRRGTVTVSAGRYRRTVVGPTQHIGKLELSRLVDGWYVTDQGVRGGLFLHGIEVRVVPLIAGFPTDLTVGGSDGPVVRLEVNVEPFVVHLEADDRLNEPIRLSHGPDQRAG